MNYTNCPFCKKILSIESHTSTASCFRCFLKPYSRFVLKLDKNGEVNYLSIILMNKLDYYLLQWNFNRNVTIMEKLLFVPFAPNMRGTTASYYLPVGMMEINQLITIEPNDIIHSAQKVLDRLINLQAFS